MDQGSLYTMTVDIIKENGIQDIWKEKENYIILKENQHIKGDFVKINSMEKECYIIIKPNNLMDDLIIAALIMQMIIGLSIKDNLFKE